MPSLVSRRKAMAVLRKLKERYPDVECALIHKNPYELTAATILSAQCTDKRVNMVTPALFKKYPTPAALAKAKQEDVEALVKTTGFYRNKAKNLIGMAKRVQEEYGGRMPETMDDLLTLPGVARKTANVVLETGYGIVVGVVVDTHVGRIARRLTWTDQTDPVKVERDLCELFPHDEWGKLSHILIHHGRDLCDARKPRCGGCPVNRQCPAAV